MAYLRKSTQPRVIRTSIGVISQRDLPSADNVRWTKHKKKLVVHAVEGELITVKDAIDRWQLTLEELAEWSRKYSK